MSTPTPDTLEPFTTRMKRATRRSHSVSDALVNAKFALYRLPALSDEKVWAQGLLYFYEIFSYLEEANERQHILRSLFVDRVLYRKAAFTADLTHYFGESWKSEQRHEAVHRYLTHLERLERTHPEHILAYVYHIYMGLLSGGQILANKRKVFGNLKQMKYYKDRVTEFRGANIPQLKKEIKAAMNRIAEEMSEKEKEEFILESNNVFLLNNSIVAVIEGQNQALYELIKKAAILVIFILIFFAAYKMYK